MGASDKLVVMMLVVVFAAISFNSISADPDLLQDICVADLNSAITLNGFPCKVNATAEDFSFAGLARPGLTDNLLGSLVTLANVLYFPGVNTLGVSMARVDYAPGGLNPPHTHPRASEISFVLEGELEVAFITTENVLFSKTVKKGEVFTFPRGLIHYQKNIGKGPAALLVAFNSQNQGVQRIPSSLFAASPTVPDYILAQAFQISIEEVEEIKAKLAP